jgi:hypothetical protein
VHTYSSPPPRDHTADLSNCHPSRIKPHSDYHHHHQEGKKKTGIGIEKKEKHNHKKKKQQ